VILNTVPDEPLPVPLSRIPADPLSASNLRPVLFTLPSVLRARFTRAAITIVCKQKTDVRVNSRPIQNALQDLPSWLPVPSPKTLAIRPSNSAGKTLCEIAAAWRVPPGEFLDSPLWGSDTPIIALFKSGISTANMNTATHSTQEPATRAERLYPGEDKGNSLAGMAQRDLDAALQLLAERAQYITGASGAAVALRRDGHNDMLCHASTGSNAPELGAILSAESGLSGESVRTRQPLRCDDAESDPRVNRQSCRELGIASVVVMPIVSEDQVLGVFELFSGRPKAFDERDLSALQRLGEMVETAVQHAWAASLRVGAEVPSEESALSMVTPPPPTPEPQIAPPQSPVELQTPIKIECAAEIASSPVAVSTADSKTCPESARVTAAPANVPEAVLPARDVPSPDDTNCEAPPVVVSNDSPPKRAIFWSAPTTASTSSPTAQASDSIAVPPALRNVHRCQACGFPVSEGRVLCVDCEEKRWRGEPVQRPAKAHEPPTPALAVASGLSSVPTAVSSASAAPAGKVSQKVATDDKPPAPDSSTQPASRQQMPVRLRETALSAAPDPPAAMENVATVTTSPGLFLSAGMESQSWWAANKYVLTAVSIVGIVIAVIAWMR
jgi:hypothetical protein